NKGVVTITAETQDGGKTASTTLDIKHIVNAPVVDDAVYYNLRLKWFNDLTGGNYNYNDPNVKALVDKVVTDAQNYWTSMDKSPSKTHLWADLDDSSIDPTLTQANKDLKKSEYITTAYKRIEAMARAYQMNN
ncbi:hypothetical protein GNF66_15495, partial [Clostridium perfringens]|nr:hypothetical protein [Clostridium perfringens]